MKKLKKVKNKNFNKKMNINNKKIMKSKNKNKVLLVT